MLSAYAMVVDDPSKFYLLSDDLKKRVIAAAANTVNIQAAKTRKAAVENVNVQFNIRNGFTVKNIRYTACPKTVVTLEDVQSEVGATERADYMELQEKGGFHMPRKGGFVNIPTDKAREGGTFAGKVASTSTIRALKKRKLKGRYTHTYASSRARAVARAYVAHKTGSVIHYGKDVFEVTSFQKSGDNISFEKEMIRNVSFTKTPVKAKPWLQTASEQPAAECQQIFNSQMDKIDKI